MDWDQRKNKNKNMDKFQICQTWTIDGPEPQKDFNNVRPGLHKTEITSDQDFGRTSTTERLGHITPGPGKQMDQDHKKDSTVASSQTRIAPDWNRVRQWPVVRSLPRMDKDQHNRQLMQLLWAPVHVFQRGEVNYRTGASPPEWESELWLSF